MEYFQFLDGRAVIDLRAKDLYILHIDSNSEFLQASGDPLV